MECSEDDVEKRVDSICKNARWCQIIATGGNQK